MHALQKLLLFHALTCLGQVGADGTHIVGGSEAVPHSRPYMASLQFHDFHHCGGALVREDFVLTAAHCHMCEKPYTVVLGAHSLAAHETTKQEFLAVRAFPHPDYDEETLENDIMLLKLNGSAQLTEAVQLISLKRGRLRPASRCIISGWGDIDDKQNSPVTLQEVSVTTLLHQTCRKKWNHHPLAKTVVCGIGDDDFQGFCYGDSGGPLVCNGKAAGVVSFSGQRCGDNSTPDVYTRVSAFGDWIARVLKNN